MNYLNPFFTKMLKPIIKVDEQNKTKCALYLAFWHIHVLRQEPSKHTHHWPHQRLFYIALKKTCFI
jgi:hypothetical protein